MRETRMVCLMVVMALSAFIMLPYAMAEDQVPPAEAVKTVVEGTADATGKTVEGTADVTGKTVEGTATVVTNVVETVTGQKPAESKAEVKSENAAQQNQVEETAKTGQCQMVKGQNFTPKNCGKGKK